MKIFLTFSVLYLMSAACFAQNNIRIRITDTEHDAVFNYLLNANRPSPDISSDMIEKGKGSAYIAPSFNKDYTDFDVSGTYGISANLNVIAAMTLFTTNYTLQDKKVTGVGDLLIGTRFMFSNSNFFSSYAQGFVKIPVAASNNQLGTGKLDYHLGIVENYTGGNISCDLSASLDMLGRPDFPQSQIAIIQQAIDSVKKNYNFSFQPNYTVSFYPTYFAGDNFNLNTGLDFSRDMKLNYNSASFYLGFDCDLSASANLSTGSSFNIFNSSDYYVSTVLTLDF